MGIEYRFYLNDGCDTQRVVVSLLARDGDDLSAGQPLMEVEAGKGVHEFVCPVAGSIRFHVAIGQALREGQLLLTVEPSSPMPAEAASLDVPGWNAFGGWRPEWWRPAYAEPDAAADGGA